ncbi:hypothetical protein AAHA92_03633 [Salvia divinorum]|uniref:Myb/SANT-like domain-containing protein n=1 Tax=Salvia divinorum TaxID=28513 RepID=A0ABD1IHR3_SALDI
MGSSIPRQEFFLYKSKWSAEVDSVMLSFIVRAKNVAQWSGTVIPIPILEEAVAAIHAATRLSFTWRELYERFQFFEQRHHAFQLVVHTRGVFWNVNNNTMSASPSIWEDILKRSKLAGAYYYFGEPEFSRLTMLFDCKEIKKEKNSDVVVISDSTVPFVGPAAPPPRWSEPTYPIGEASESVSSPIVGNFATTRRKLFAEEYINLDNESTNSTAPILYVPDRDGASRPKPATSARPQPRAIAFNPAASPHGSSCGSTSPNNWWRNNRK